MNVFATGYRTVSEWNLAISSRIIKVAASIELADGSESVTTTTAETAIFHVIERLPKNGAPENGKQETAFLFFNCADLANVLSRYLILFMIVVIWQSLFIICAVSARLALHASFPPEGDMPFSSLNRAA